MTIDVSGLINLKMEEFLYDDGWFIEFLFTKQFLLKAEKITKCRFLPACLGVSFVSGCKDFSAVWFVNKLNHT